MTIVEAKKHQAPRPTKLTLYMRSSLPWQLFRFIIVNIRMTVMILKSHGRYVGPRQSEDG
jgi:hypothetical protein